jgi:3-hydroxyacyl-[acyl-carrier-protein] dehydratase
MNHGTASWMVPPDHPAFAGHFPGAPIVPGVLLLDAAIHAVETACGRPLLPGRISAAKFLRPVGPGETLSIRYAVENSGAVRLELRSGAHLVASATCAPPADAAAS